MSRLSIKKLRVLGVLYCSLFWFFSPTAFAETPAQKAASEAKKSAAQVLLPVIPPPYHRLPLFKVNSPIRLKNSNLQVLAGKKFPNTPIFINNKLVIPTNKYNTWYYEHPLTSGKPNKVVISSGLITLRNPPYFQVLNLDTVTTLNVNPPRISRIRVDPHTRDIILTIEDPPGVLSYNVYFADQLGASGSTTPFTLAQADYAVSGSGTTEWRDNGTYTRIPPLSPQVKMRFYRLEVARVDLTNFQLTGITPADGSTILAGAKIDIQASVFNPQNEILWYQFSLGGTVVQSWSTLNTYTWETTASDTGAVSITCEVKNNAGNRQVSKTVAYRIINPTLEGILQKVADNYGLINDKTMDVTVTSDFDPETPQETLYTRHYFLKPDKQRTDTFFAPNRSDASKSEIHIVNGPDNYLIDPVNHTTVQENLLVKYNLTLSQLEELDEIYHPQAFLSRHLVIRRDNPQDLSQGLIQIDAFAKNPTQGNYLGYGMKIDFFKGLKVKSMVYLKEYDEEIEDKTMKLKQLIEVTDSQRMPNGAWVPKAERKILYFPSGEIKINYNFENIRVNTGLSDGLFDPAEQ